MDTDNLNNSSIIAESINLDNPIKTTLKKIKSKKYRLILR